jgi:hypothetical protein
MTPEQIQQDINKIARAVLNIPGWLWPREVDALYRKTMHSKLHLEVGSFCGKSLYVTAAAMNGGRIIAIDPLSIEILPQQATIVPDYEWNREVLRSTIKSIHNNFATKIEWWDITSVTAIQKATQQNLMLDSVYIDGNHHQAECEADIVGWSKLVKPGGYILGHDYFPNNMGVISAVNRIYNDKFHIIPETRIWVHNKN